MEQGPGLIERAKDAVLDATVVLSYGRAGFGRHARWFGDEAARDMRGRVCLVTGASSGIGLATAKSLAARSAEVWLLCRDPGRCDAARDEVAAAAPRDGAVRAAVVDVSDLAAVRAFAERFERPRVDVLVHNAGVLPAERRVTAQGLELTVATNLVGPFALTWGLRDRLAAASDARVIHVTSGGMYPRRLSTERLRSLRGRFDGVAAYADTKRALVVLTELLATRLAARGATVVAMHPGWADTKAVRSSLPRFWWAARAILRSAAEGADTVVWLATGPLPREASGSLWFDRRRQPAHVFPWTHETEAERRRLWSQLCEWAEIDPEAAW
jgi:NAD(P)-dependent dehydrogenase (short-subunit alcohol dehydrogenase family)